MYLLGILCHLLGRTEEKHARGFVELDLLVCFLYATGYFIATKEKERHFLVLGNDSGDFNGFNKCGKQSSHGGQHDPYRIVSSKISIKKV